MIISQPENYTLRPFVRFSKELRWRFLVDVLLDSLLNRKSLLTWWSYEVENTPSWLGSVLIKFFQMQFISLGLIEALFSILYLIYFGIDQSLNNPNTLSKPSWSWENHKSITSQGWWGSAEGLASLDQVVAVFTIKNSDCVLNAFQK